MKSGSLVASGSNWSATGPGRTPALLSDEAGELRSSGFQLVDQLGADRLAVIVRRA
ncbi:hypothetical protein ACWGI8_35940 [Streptomyces sp. NPDC054841]